MGKRLVAFVVAVALASATGVPALAAGPPGPVATGLLNLACVLGVPAGLGGQGFVSFDDFDNGDGTRTHIARSAPQAPDGVTLTIVYVDTAGTDFGFSCGDVIQSVSISPA